MAGQVLSDLRNGRGCPVTDEERVRLRGLWESQWAQGTPEEAVVLVSVAILQAPAFVFRVEGTSVERMEGDVIRLNDWEMASRLSYFLWDSMPDGALFEAASRGALRTRAGIKKEARRMLADPKARPALVRFHDHLLGTKRTLTVSPARRAYGPLFGISESPPWIQPGMGCGRVFWDPSVIQWLGKPPYLLSERCSMGKVPFQH